MGTLCVIPFLPPLILTEIERVEMSWGQGREPKRLRQSLINSDQLKKMTFLVNMGEKMHEFHMKLSDNFLDNLLNILCFPHYVNQKSTYIYFHVRNF